MLFALPGVEGGRGCSVFGSPAVLRVLYFSSGQNNQDTGRQQRQESTEVEIGVQADPPSVPAEYQQTISERDALARESERDQLLEENSCVANELMEMKRQQERTLRRSRILERKTQQQEQQKKRERPPVKRNLTFGSVQQHFDQPTSTSTPEGKPSVDEIDGSAASPVADYRWLGNYSLFILANIGK